MSKRVRSRRKRRKARRLATSIKVRSPMPPPCQNFGDARKQTSKMACRGRVEIEG
jgi:hypothetical protein